MKILKGPPSVGEIITELYLSPSGISPEDAADLCQLDQKVFFAILDEDHQIGYETAYKLAKGFNTTHNFWLNIQTDYIAAKNGE